MTYQRTFAIKVTCDHEPDDYEEDKALDVFGKSLWVAITMLKANLPDGWHAEEADEVER